MLLVTVFVIVKVGVNVTLQTIQAEGIIISRAASFVICVEIKRRVHFVDSFIVAILYHVGAGRLFKIIIVNRIARVTGFQRQRFCLNIAFTVYK